MSKKCVKCGAPIEGFMAKIARLFGVKKSAIDPNCCNKCDGSEVQKTPVPEPPKSEMPVESPKVESLSEPLKVEMPPEPPTTEPEIFSTPSVELPKTDSIAKPVMTEPAGNVMEKPADDLMKKE